MTVGCGNCGRKMRSNCCQEPILYKLNGIKANPKATRNWGYFACFIRVIFSLLIIAWGINNGGINLDDQNDDRYFTFTFWRVMGIPGLDILALLIFEKATCNLSPGWLRISCITSSLFILVNLAALGWLAYDFLFDCANIPHCDGDGNAIFFGAFDLAFGVLAAILIAKILLLLLMILVVQQLRSLYKECNLVSNACVTEYNENDFEQVDVQEIPCVN